MKALSNNYVQFDDYKVTHTKSNVVQYNEYYPFGMNAANSWTRENTTGNQYQYNQATELNGSTGYYDLFFRNFDPVLARFVQVDPLASRYHNQSTYQYGNNDPVYWSDPSGAGGDAGHAWETMTPNQRADAAFDAINSAGSGMFGGAWSIMAYGTYGEGGSAFSRYGAENGALYRDMSSVWKGSHGAKTRALIHKLLNSPNGGFINSNRVSYFNSPTQAAAAGAAHITNSNGWMHTEVVKAIKKMGLEKARAAQMTHLQATILPLPFFPPGSSYYGRLRHFTGPDAIAITGNIDLVIANGQGVDVTPFGVVLMLRGPDAGAVVPILDAGYAVGLDFSAAIGITNLYFNGEEEDLTSNNVTGFRFEANLAFSPGLDLGYGFSFAPNMSANSFLGYFNNAMFGESYSIGVSLAFPIVITGNVNIGYTMKWSQMIELINRLRK